MKALFLDIDGVLNSYPSRLAANNIRQGDFGTHRAWKPESVAALKRVIAETGCDIIISSDWKFHLQDLQDGFDAFELPDWRSCCPILGQNNATNCNRGNEIDAWIKQAERNGETVEAYAIVDDNNWMQVVQQRNFVQTSDDTGLTESDASDLIWILNRKSESFSV